MIDEAERRATVSQHPSVVFTRAVKIRGGILGGVIGGTVGLSPLVILSPLQELFIRTYAPYSTLTAIVMTLILVPAQALIILVAYSTLLPAVRMHPYTKRLLHRKWPKDVNRSLVFPVEIVLSPRLRKRNRISAFLHPSDDIGLLSLSADGFTYAGDEVSMNAPWMAVLRASAHTPIARSLLLGPCITLTLCTLDGEREVTIRAMGGWTLLSANAQYRSLLNAIQSHRGMAHMAGL